MGKATAKTAGMTRLFGAAFATAAVTACAFAGTAFADDGYAADRVQGFYDDQYALMATDGEDGVTNYALIDTSYKAVYEYTSEEWSSYESPVTNYGILVRDKDTYKYGLLTYTGKTLLDSKYDAIEYNDDALNPTVFAVYTDKGKVIVERYARGTSKVIDTLEIDSGAKEDVSVWAYINAASDEAVIVRYSYYDSEKDEVIEAYKTIAYDADGMTVTEFKAPDGSELIGSLYKHSVTGFYYGSIESKDSDESQTAWFTADGTLLSDLTGWDFYSVKNNVNTKEAEAYLFVKSTTADGKTTSKAMIVDLDGKAVQEFPEQSVDSGSSTRSPYITWGFFGDSVYTYPSSYYNDETSKSVYGTLRVYAADASLLKEIANVSNANASTYGDDKTPYMRVWSYDGTDNDSRSYSSYTTYYDASMNEMSPRIVNMANAEQQYKNADSPSTYMLDGTRLYAGGKRYYDQNDGVVQRAGQYIASLTSAVASSNATLRIGSADAFIATTDNGKYGIVTSDGKELAASENDGVHTQFASNLAMVHRDGKWYFVDLTDNARKVMHRLYNPNSGEHFYTSNDAEADNLVSLGWNNEGTGWIAPGGSSQPVYRLYNPYAGEHHYTMTTDERDMLVSVGWVDEGVGWFSSPSNDYYYGDESNYTSQALHREYNPNAFANNHNYTPNDEEHQMLIDAGWNDEGKAWYGLAVPEPIDDANAKAETEDTKVETQSNQYVAVTL